MSSWVDLHLHTHCSDGAESPSEIVRRAAGHPELKAIAITDHDSTDGIAEAQRTVAETTLQLLTGVEISASFQDREIHVLGLGIRPEEDGLQRQLKELVEMRARRAESIVHRLRRLGLSIDDHPAFRTASPAFPYGRMHIASALRDLGIVNTVQAAFDRYLNRGCPAHVAKQLPPAQEAIAAIRQAGGLAFIAHPGLGHWIYPRLRILLDLPFDGIEAYHISHTPARTKELIRAARERNLLVSGGSDCHGNVKGEGLLIGKVRTPENCYARILDALNP